MELIEKLIQKMSVHEKIGQLTQYNANLFVSTDTDITGPKMQLGLTDEDISTVGSVLNFSSAEEMIQIQNDHLEKDPNKIPIVFMMDVIHGYRTIYPIPLAMACSFDINLVQECSRMAAKEASANGVHVTFAPMVDYVRDPRWGRVLETCGEDPLLASELAKAQIAGYQGEDISKADSVATCVKHFAAYGGAEAGRDYNAVECSVRELREYYFPAYKACIEAGAPLVMPSFNSLNGKPSVVNPWLMKKILREEWGFDGVVISDYNAINELISHGVAENEETAAKMAFENGCHIEMCSSTYFHHLANFISSGVFSEEQLDDAVRHVLLLKEKLGLFNDPYRGVKPEAADVTLLCADHRSLSKKAALEAAVLLKNNGILPLPVNMKSVAIIGPFADEHAIIGAWSCQGRNEESVTVAEGFAKVMPHIQCTVVKGCGNAWNDDDLSGLHEAITAAKTADAVVLCLGEPQDYSGEGNCRTDLGLPGVQMELAKAVIAANPNTVAVLFNGRPLAIEDLDNIAPAILDMWFPGTEGGSAVTELLFGYSNPCGKLAMTFPRSVGQCPIYYNHPNNGRPNWTTEVKHIGYSSDYVDCATLPLYSFGHGLSYSNFVYKDLMLSDDLLNEQNTIQVSVTLRNESDYVGKEVVQLYMHDLYCSVIQPVQKLIGFQKVELKPWEERQVVFTVKESHLRFWNFEDQYVSEPGEVELMVGHADHFVLTERITLRRQ